MVCVSKTVDLGEFIDCKKHVKCLQGADSNLLWCIASRRGIIVSHFLKMRMRLEKATKIALILINFSSFETTSGS